MEKYDVYLQKLALADLSDIYSYIASELQEPGVAVSMVERIETELRSLSYLPYRYPIRHIGAYANRDYRNLSIKNYIVVYRIEEEQKRVIIIRILHSLQNH